MDPDLTLHTSRSASPRPFECVHELDMSTSTPRLPPRAAYILSQIEEAEQEERDILQRLESTMLARADADARPVPFPFSNRTLDAPAHAPEPAPPEPEEKAKEDEEPWYFIQAHEAAAILEDRAAYARYRDLLESSLHSTGMTQCDVIAWLADQLLLQAVDSVVAEVQQLHDTVSQALLDAV